MENKQTIHFASKPVIQSGYSIVGPKEATSLFAQYFDYKLKNDFFGEKTYEKAERKILEQAILGAVEKAAISINEVDAMLSGDLLNQIISSGFAARQFNSSFIGLFGACSTMAEGLALGAMMVDGSYFSRVVCATSSHFSTAERQFRYPLELGNQRPPTSQWTVTGAGATILGKDGNGPCITSATLGKVVDWGVIDVNNMGAAMAPAAATTLSTHFHNTKTKPEDYDLVLTGDLGKLGSEILVDLLEEEDFKLGTNYCDCGQMIFHKQDKTFMGGSGAACSAVIFNSYVLNKLQSGQYKKVLFVATGALLSTTSSQQGDSIPCIAHAIVVEANQKEKHHG